MGHRCCSKQKVKRGLWSPEEDEKLLNYINTHGHGSWSSVPKQAGLQRCGKSCRLRWINYLKPDLKRGSFTAQEEQIIIDVHRILGNRWAQIAKHLPGRTDNEVKNFWNSYIKKKLISQGLDPKTHNLIPSHKRANIGILNEKNNNMVTYTTTIPQHDPQALVPFSITNTSTTSNTSLTPCINSMDVVLETNYSTKSSPIDMIPTSGYLNPNGNDVHCDGNGSTNILLDDNYQDNNAINWSGNDTSLGGIDSIVEPYRVPRPSTVLVEQSSMQPQQQEGVGFGKSSSTSDCFDLDFVESTLLSASISQDIMSSMDDDLAWIF